MNSPRQTKTVADPLRSAVTRTIRVGGMSKAELLARLSDAKVELNESARVLFAHDKFTTSSAVSNIQTVEVSVADLGCLSGGGGGAGGEGATIERIHERAAACGLSLCPLELGPHMRLQYLDQPEGFIGHPPSQHRAPPGSLTIASPELTSDDEIPKGFYLRRIEGVLWLRGYRSGADHLWSPEDVLVFVRS